MAVVIPNEVLERHNVNKYNFKILAMGSNKLEEQQNIHDEKIVSSTPLHQETPQVQTQHTPPSPEIDSVDSSAMSQDSKNALIESLMKKTEEMTSNFIKLQMKLESKEEEYKREIQQAKEEAFAQGMQEQLKQMQENESVQKNSALVQLSNSVTTLENSAKEFSVALENIKGELMIAALDISKEVIQVELHQNSNEVAKALADSLISELQSASQITLKVNPINHGAISEKVGHLEYINVISDSAISEGGVIVISNAGNIDAQISKRFEKVKRAVLSE